MGRVKKYYDHIISNVEIDRTNPNNSYVMWTYDKVDAIDKTKPCKIVLGKVSMPDIDLDFPTVHKELVYKYIQQKYGANKVSKIATFLELKGREALTQVLRAHDWGDYKERKEITKLLPKEDQISDKLQEMVEETGESSIILYALKHQAEDLAQYCVLTDEGEFTGPLAPLFAQAVRLENCCRGKGTHPSGVVISDVPLAEICPIVYDDKKEESLAGFAFGDLESLGLLKADLLGVSVLDRMLGVYETLETGEITSDG